MKRSDSRQNQQRHHQKTKIENKKGSRWSLGLHSVRETLKIRPKEILCMYLKTQWESSHELTEIANEARSHQISIVEVSSENIDKIGGNSQGVAVEIKDLAPVSIDLLGTGSRSIILFLDGVEDPHNLGAILRTSWLLGVEAIVLPVDRSVGLTPTVHKVSCGGVEHVPVLRVSNLTHAINHFKEKGFWVYGLSSRGKNSLLNMRLNEKMIWILGAEGKGMRSTTEKICDELVFIPQADNAASYNVSVAAGITIYESYRQLSLEKL